MTFCRSGICLLLAAALVSSADTPSTLASVPHAKQLYYQGIYGDKNASAQADKVFTALHKANPSDPLVSVYYGSLRLLEAAHTWALWRKNSLSKEGIRLMDAAVERAPENLEIRFVRAATELNLPAFFGRHQQAEQEFATLAPQATTAARSGLLEPRLAAATLFYYGQICQQQSRRSEAIEAWKSAASIAPESHAGQAAAKLIKTT